MTWRGRALACSWRAAGRAGVGVGAGRDTEEYTERATISVIEVGDHRDHGFDVTTQRSRVRHRRGAHLLSPPDDGPHDHGRLGRPAPVDRRLADMCPGGNVVHAQAVVAVLGQPLESGLQDGGVSRRIEVPRTCAYPAL